jgi:hypothetical protein
MFMEIGICSVNALQLNNFYERRGEGEEKVLFDVVVFVHKLRQLQ